MRSWLSNPSPTPPTFDATLDQGLLQRFLQPVSALDNRTELTVSSDGLTLTTVADVRIRSVEAKLHADSCFHFDVDTETAAGCLAIDPAPLYRALQTEPERQELATLAYDPDEGSLTLDLPTVSHTQYPTVETGIEIPRIDDWPGGATVHLHAGDLKRAIDYVAPGAESLAVGYDEADNALYLESFNGDIETEASGDTHVPSSDEPADEHYEFRRSRSELPGEVSPGSARSVFTTSILESTLEVLPDDEVIRADIGEAYLLRLQWPITRSKDTDDGVTDRGDGPADCVTVLVAPQTPSN